MRIKWKEFVICIAIPLLVGAIAGVISGGSREAYDALVKPPLSPPGWLFPVVWTTLYTLMGIASYLVLTSDGSGEDTSNALFVYALQLLVNFFWPILFFNLELYLFAFIWLLFLWVLIQITMLRFYRVNKTATFLLVPYFVWVTFAAYLNLAIYLLNR